jgi:hypothetical protein
MGGAVMRQDEDDVGPVGGLIAIFLALLVMLII